MNEPSPEARASAEALAPEVDRDKLVVLYDGVCGLCNRFIQFLLRRDRGDRFRFAPLQSELGREAVRARGGDPDELSTVYVIERFGTADEVVRVRGRAALRCLTELGGPWRLLGAFRVLPGFALDAGYRLVARVRYRLFGKLERCPVPSAEDRAKFLSQG